MVNKGSCTGYSSIKFALTHQTFDSRESTNGKNQISIRISFYLINRRVVDNYNRVVTRSAMIFVDWIFPQCSTWKSLSRIDREKLDRWKLWSKRRVEVRKWKIARRMLGQLNFVLGEENIYEEVRPWNLPKYGKLIRGKSKF